MISSGPLTSGRATATGLLAILLWSAVIGLIRSVSESFGPTGGAALIYSTACGLLLLTTRPPKLLDFPRRYLAWGGLLFVTYEICLALSIGHAGSSRQAIEVSMVNYLWPTFTMLAAILFNGQRAGPLILPGAAISLAGVLWVLGGDQGLDPAALAANVRSNPLSYALALAAAVLWSVFSVVTARISGGKNATIVFFALTAAVLWIKYAAMGGGSMAFTPRSAGTLLLAAAAMGFGYVAWNIGILHGNMVMLAGASYFTPILSVALSALVLSTPLALSFWQGAAMVCAGSMLCWMATRGR
ncbi:hypothetical protein BKE38_20060 [Pseudoroseomonas deserti]|uniref:EamA domain-containing protein n=2 Tax=Teichococcus deserti TaxID=1817963 RepID=A0A1V2H029_9PROT|nr:hypothetical protein BKE38_20060 [Pseudoroseomonas deserti]